MIQCIPNDVSGMTAKNEQPNMLEENNLNKVLTDPCKTKTKVITLANHKGHGIQ